MSSATWQPSCIRNTAPWLLSLLYIWVQLNPSSQNWFYIGTGSQSWWKWLGHWLGKDAQKTKTKTYILCQFLQLTHSGLVCCFWNYKEGSWASLDISLYLHSLQLGFFLGHWSHSQILTMQLEWYIDLEFSNRLDLNIVKMYKRILPHQRSQLNSLYPHV